MDQQAQSSTYYQFATLFTLIFPNLSAGIVISALAGSTVFFMTSDEYSRFQKIILTLVSFCIGLIASKEATQYINIIAPINVSESVGALITSAFAVNVILFLRNKLKLSKNNEDSNNE